MSLNSLKSIKAIGEGTLRCQIEKDTLVKNNDKINKTTKIIKFNKK